MLRTFYFLSTKSILSFGKSAEILDKFTKPCILGTHGTKVYRKSLTCQKCLCFVCVLLEEMFYVIRFCLSKCLHWESQMFNQKCCFYLVGISKTYLRPLLYFYLVLHVQIGLYFFWIIYSSTEVVYSSTEVINLKYHCTQSKQGLENFSSPREKYPSFR